MRVSLITATLWLLATSCTAPAIAAPEPTPPVHDHAAMLAAQADRALDALPGTSVHLLPVRLEEAGHPPYALHDLAGKPVVVTLFYSSCRSVCPVLTFAMRRLEASLPAAKRDQVTFLMVSLDSDRDTPAVLAAFAAEHQLSASHWHIAHTDVEGVRLLSAALGIRYRRLEDEIGRAHV